MAADEVAALAVAAIAAAEIAAVGVRAGVKEVVEECVVGKGG